MHSFPSISATIIFMGASVNSNMTKSSADQRNVNMVQSVYIRTLSVDPLEKLMKGAYFNRAADCPARRPNVIAMHRPAAGM